MVSFIYEMNSLLKVNIPKKIRTYCKVAKKHTIHKVSQYKKGKENKFNQGINIFQKGI